MKKANTPKNTSAKSDKMPESGNVDISTKTGDTQTTSILSDDLLRKLFFFSLLAMLVITFICGYNSGFNSDEIEMNGYGKANLAYYTSGGKDTSIMGADYKLLKYYGNAFEMFAQVINKVTGIGKGPNEFNVRHIVNQVFAILGLLFTGLLVKRVSKNWLSSIFTVWLLFLTPSFMGHFIFNTRDIPFCTGYLATLYFIIRFLEELPSPTWKTTVGIMVSFAFSINVRIGGALLLFYFFLFTALFLLTNKELLLASLKNVQAIILKMASVVVGGVLLAIVTWPFILMHPKALIEAFGVASKFPLKVMINFEGTTIDSLHVPMHYIPKFMFVTIPLFVIFCILAGVATYFYKIKKYDWRWGVILLFSILFPITYAITSNAALYSSWRHFLFVFPLMAAFGGIFLNELFTQVKKLPIKLALAAVCLLTMVKPILFCIKNNPYQYSYFNEVAGDFKNAFMAYDTDYWEISVKNGVDWLIANEHIDQAKDTVTVASNASIFASYYIGRHYPKAKIKVISSGVTSRNELGWTYAVYNSLFVKPDYLENFFPPAQTIHTEYIEGMPATVVVKDTARLDLQALNALRVANHKLADSLYTAYKASTKDNNPAIDAYIAVAKASLNQNEAAIVAANRALQYHFSNVLDYNAQCGLGIAYANKLQFELSINALKIAERLMPKETYSKDILKQVYRVMAEIKAKPELRQQILQQQQQQQPQAQPANKSLGN